MTNNATRAEQVHTFLENTKGMEVVAAFLQGQERSENFTESEEAEFHARIRIGLPETPKVRTLETLRESVRAYSIRMLEEYCFDYGLDLDDDDITDQFEAFVTSPWFSDDDDEDDIVADNVIEFPSQDNPPACEYTEAELKWFETLDRAADEQKRKYSRLSRSEKLRQFRISALSYYRGQWAMDYTPGTKFKRGKFIEVRACNMGGGDKIYVGMRPEIISDFDIGCEIEGDVEVKNLDFDGHTFRIHYGFVDEAETHTAKYDLKKCGVTVISEEEYNDYFSKYIQPRFKSVEFERYSDLCYVWEEQELVSVSEKQRKSWVAGKSLQLLHTHYGVINKEWQPMTFKDDVSYTVLEIFEGKLDGKAGHLIKMRKDGAKRSVHYFRPADLVEPHLRPENQYIEKNSIIDEDGYLLEKGDVVPWEDMGKWTVTLIEQDHATNRITWEQGDRQMITFESIEPVEVELTPHGTDKAKLDREVMKVCWDDHMRLLTGTALDTVAYE